MGDHQMMGWLEGWQVGGANRSVPSPIEGLPDVEQSHAVSAVWQDPEAGLHQSVMLPGIVEQGVVVNAADMDEEEPEQQSGAGGATQQPPMGSKVIKVHAARRQPEAAAAPSGYQPVRKGKGGASADSRAAPF